jgi:Ca2+-binding RTX toxin-like protein
METPRDILYGSWGATIQGEGDDDTMCAASGTTVNQFIGGSGNDTYGGAKRGAEQRVAGLQ